MWKTLYYYKFYAILKKFKSIKITYVARGF